MNAVKPLNELTDQELAETYLQYVILHQQASVEKRLELSTQRESIAELYAALQHEIERRGMVWQCGLTGNVWLDKAESAS